MSKRQGGRPLARRLCAAGLAIVTGSVLAVSGSLPAFGIPTDPGDSPCLGSTGSLSVSPSTIFLGQSVAASWTTQRPGGCGTVSILSGPGTSGAVNGVGGSQTVFPPSVGTATYTVTVGYPGGTVDVASQSVRVLAAPHVPVVAFAAVPFSPQISAYEVTPTGSQVPIAPGLAAVGLIAAGTSPATAWDLAGGVQAVAVHANGSNTLKYVDTGATVHDTGTAMATGTSPSIAGLAVSVGGAEVAFAGSDTLLRKVNVANGVVGLAGNGLGVAAGTNPAIAADASGGYAIAFHANGEDTLWWVDRNNVGHDTGLKMAAGSSPSITEMPNSTNYTVAFVGDGNLLRVYDTATATARFYNLGVEPGTAPVVRDTGATTYETAFQAQGEHDLWTLASSNTLTDTHVPMAAGTSPSMASLSGGGFQILVNNGTTRTMWEYTSDGQQWDTKVHVTTGTTPATANIFDYPASHTAFNPPMPVPDPNWNEIFDPFQFNGSFNMCLDDPGGGTTVMQPMQLYHCHGYASNGAPQRWRIIDPLGDGSEYQVMNLASGECLTIADNNGGYGEPIMQAPCGGALEGCSAAGGCDLWQMLPTPDGSDYFALYNIQTLDICMEVSPYGDNTQVITAHCDLTIPNLNWSLG